MFLLTAGVLQHCYSQPDCAGDVVDAPGTTEEDCCIRTFDGQSYSDDGVNCTVSQCIGEYEWNSIVFFESNLRSPPLAYLIFTQHSMLLYVVIF